MSFHRYSRPYCVGHVLRDVGLDCIDDGGCGIVSNSDLDKLVQPSHMNTL
jgi:hypothetical protein